MAERPRPRLWNHWWTLTVVTAVLTAIVMFLEYLGVFRDFGLFLSGLGVIATVVFGAAAATGTSVSSLEVSLERIELRLDKLDKLDRMEIQLSALDRIGTTQFGVLDRLEALLRERLPRPD
jgi:hypothetical protein